MGKPVLSVRDNICQSDKYCPCQGLERDERCLSSWRGLNLDYSSRFPHLRRPARVSSESEDEAGGLRAEDGAAGGSGGGDETEREAR